ncbi:hypothetical protein GCM10009544_44730 [Streptomyces stramineus]|uniref:Uncharacterized protein n=1 Tax=Streptomyces stramineus TaxID=173861 RepID=A0ABP3KEF6_9ACTN
MASYRSSSAADSRPAVARSRPAAAGPAEAAESPEHPASSTAEPPAARAAAPPASTLRLRGPDGPRVVESSATILFPPVLS